MKVYIVKDYTNDVDFLMEEPCVIFGVYDSFDKAHKVMLEKAEQFAKNNKIYIKEEDFSDEMGIQFRTADKCNYYEIGVIEREVE